MVTSKVGCSCHREIDKVSACLPEIGIGQRGCSHTDCTISLQGRRECMVIVALCIEGEIIFSFFLYDGQTFWQVDVKLESYIFQLAGVGSADIIGLELNGNLFGFTRLNGEVRDVELVIASFYDFGLNGHYASSCLFTSLSGNSNFTSLQGSHYSINNGSNSFVGTGPSYSGICSIFGSYSSQEGYALIFSYLGNCLVKSDTGYCNSLVASGRTCNLCCHIW